MTTVSTRQRKKTEALLRQAIANESVDALIRKTALAVWDDLYRSIKDRKLGELLHLTANARWVAEQCTAALLPLLNRPSLLRLASDEIALAAAERK